MILIALAALAATPPTTELQRLQAPDVMPNAMLGDVVRLSDRTLGARAGGPPAPSLHLFRREGTTWAHEQTLSTQIASFDAFDVGDDHIVVRDNRSLLGDLPGLVHVFTRGSNGWSLTHSLAVPPSDRGARFITSLVVDGDRIAAGVLDVHGAEQFGAVVLFCRDGTAWVFEDEVVSNEPDDGFGTAIDLDDDQVVVGASVDGEQGEFSGTAFIYRYDGASWSLDAELNDESVDQFDRFGRSVAIDGDTAIVGATSHRGSGNDSGAAFVYERVDGHWRLDCMLVEQAGSSTFRYGSSVAVDDGVAVVESYFGGVHVYERIDEDWIFDGALRPNEGELPDGFGDSVDLDNGRIAVGAFGDDVDAPNAGSVYLFGACGADFAEPFGVLDIADLIAWSQLFSANDPSADLALPEGLFDIGDVLAFLGIFDAGCP